MEAESRKQGVSCLLPLRRLRRQDAQTMLSALGASGFDVIRVLHPAGSARLRMPKP